MIKTLRRVQKSSWKPEKRSDGVALPSRRLLFPDPCLNMKSNFYSDSEKLDLASGQLQQRKLLDTTLRPSAFKGPSRRLHRNRLFWLGNCMESSWTSSKKLWPYTWHEMRQCSYYLKTLNRTDNHVKKQPLHKVFLSPECCKYKY
jgi:hypothetical protein